MSNERRPGEEGGEEPFRLRWPPSPRTQIILIAVGFGLFNLLLVVIWAMVLYLGR